MRIHALCFLCLEAPSSLQFLAPLSIFQVSNTVLPSSDLLLWVFSSAPHFLLLLLRTFTMTLDPAGSSRVISLSSSQLTGNQNSPLPWKATYLQFAGIVTWTSLGDHYPTTTWEKGSEWASVKHFEEESIIVWWKELFLLKLETWEKTTTCPHDCPWIWTNHLMSLSLSIFICRRDNNNYLPEKSGR